MAKKVAAIVKLQVKAGEASPSPPVGTALGPHGVNIMNFCKAFNAETEKLEKGLPIPVEITVYADRTMKFTRKEPPVSALLKRELGLEKGSATPNTEKVGKATRANLENVAKLKMPDLNAVDMEGAVRTIAGQARSMGIDVEGVE